jgi:hypothetical protein
MVWVFGLFDIPLAELMFVFFLLLTAGLVFILFELRRLRALLSEETSDISRFEADLKRLEADEGKTNSSKLQDYVRAAIARGMSEQQVEQTLVGRGWKKEVVDQMFESLQKQVKPQQVQPRR